MVWTCAEDGTWIYWTRDAEDGAVRPVEERMTSKKTQRIIQRVGVTEKGAENRVKKQS